MLGDGLRERHAALTPPQVTQVRNILRTALSAAQELKTRLKQSATEAQRTQRKEQHERLD